MSFSNDGTSNPQKPKPDGSRQAATAEPGRALSIRRFSTVPPCCTCPRRTCTPIAAIWKRDFAGASGLFSIVLKPAPQKAVDALLNAVKPFGMGYSWGGFESLMIPFDCASYRTATKWAPGGPALRLHIGLENVEDLKCDLERGLAAFHAA